MIFLMGSLLNGSIPKFLEIFFQRREYLYELLIQHFVLSLTSIIIIVIIGTGTGIALLRYKEIRQVVLGFVNFIYTIPSIAMFGLFIPLVGIGFVNALVVLVIYGLLPMIRNTYTGLNEVDPLYIDAGWFFSVSFRATMPAGRPGNIFYHPRVFADSSV